MLKNIALIAASLVLALVAAEIGLRIARVSYPSLYEEDGELGDRLRPGAEGWTHGEGGAYVRINSDGMRDREHSIAKPPGTMRWCQYVWTNVIWPSLPESTICLPSRKCSQLRCCVPVWTICFEVDTTFSSASPSASVRETGFSR
jgi:hypothetical protein